MSYILIPFIEVQRANAQATPWMISPLPIFAAAMLSHAVADDLGFEATGMAYIHHNAQLLAERDLPQAGSQVFPHQFRGASFINKKDYSSKNQYAISIQPSFSTNLLCSLVIEIDGPAPSSEAVNRVLSGRRLAGGLIISHGRIASCELRKELDAILPKGFVAVDRTQLLAGNPITSLLSQTHEPTPDMHDGVPKKPWRSATVLGYTAITDFAQRKGVRDNLPHAFAEPMVGLVDLISLRQLGRHPGQNIFWAWGWPDPGIFLLSQPPSSIQSAH